MLKVKEFFAGLLGVCFMVSANAVELYGMADVNVTSDTAAAAKNMAFDEARRQIAFDALRQYADVDALQQAIKQAKTSELTELIAASSIDGEQLSDTTYSAKIAMTIDERAARSWLDAKSVQHWLPDDDRREVFVVNVQMSDGLKNWIELNNIARAERVDLGTIELTGSSAVLELPAAARGKFTIAIREGGWRYQTKDGVLNIWK